MDSRFHIRPRNWFHEISQFFTLWIDLSSNQFIFAIKLSIFDLKLIASRQLFNFEEQKCPRFFRKSYHLVDIADFMWNHVNQFLHFSDWWRSRSRYRSWPTSWHEQWATYESAYRHHREYECQDPRQRSKYIFEQNYYLDWSWPI